MINGLRMLVPVKDSNMVMSVAHGMNMNRPNVYTVPKRV